MPTFPSTWHWSPPFRCRECIGVHPQESLRGSGFEWFMGEQNSLCPRNPWNISHSESSGIIGMCNGKKCYAQKVQGTLNSLFMYNSFYSLGVKRKIPLLAVLWRLLHHCFSHSSNSAETAVLLSWARSHELHCSEHVPGHYYLLVNAIAPAL